MRISHCIVLLDTDIQTQEVDGEIFWYDALARQYKVRVILKQIFFSLFSSLSSSLDCMKKVLSSKILIKFNAVVSDIQRCISQKIGVQTRSHTGN
jgi:hypothetical protein